MLFAQDSIPDYDFISEKNPWLNCANAAGLNKFEGDKLSMTAMTANKSDGDFTNYYQSNNSYSFDLLTKTYYRLNEKVTVYGHINYSYFKGKNMGGSAFIDPYYTAFNIVEMADSTAGNKLKESYAIIGGISNKLSDKLYLGAMIDYKNVSYFKTKDLRHTNDLLDLNMNVGMLYKLRAHDIGFSYLYHRSVESIIFDSFGNTDQQYYTLIDYGGFFGEDKPFDDAVSGMSSGGYENPYFNEENGLSLQLHLFNDQALSYFNEFVVKLGKGHYGRQGTATVVYTQHSSTTLAYHGVLSQEREQSLHQLKVDARYYESDNELNDYVIQNDTLMGNVVIYGISQKVNNKTNIDLSMGYTGYWGIQNGKALWSLTAKGTYKTSLQRSIYYNPLIYRDQEINQYRVKISAYRNFFKDRNSYRISGGVAYGTGSGLAFDDTYFTTSQGELVTLDHLAYQEFEYFTADRIYLNLGLRYSRLINGNKNKIYGELKYNAIKAFNTEYLGDYWSNLSFNLGYRF